MLSDLRRRPFLILLKCAFLALAVALVAGPPTSTRSESSARELLVRLIGDRADSFVVKTIPKQNGLDIFEVEARDGTVYISGSSGVAIARGAYEYLKDACHCQVTWDGNQLNLPKNLPDYPKTKVRCPNRYRYYFNVCTFGYSTVWWDWKRWEKEIDWMALHGMNMPLAMNGQEAVWRDVWHSYGLTDEDLKPFFSGPAFLPWHRMGNLNGYGGPLPQSWIDDQRELQKKILERERELGMTPVVPAFAGFVPEALKTAHPEIKITQSSGWCGFAPTYLVQPTDKAFVSIGKRFIKAYRKQYGTDHLYLADTFNEMRPKLSKEHPLTDLAKQGQAVYKSITAGDPRGIWLMQGWLFLDDAFWNEDRANALLSRVPDNKMIVLDLADDRVPVWKQKAAVRKKLWIHCMLHNFGQNTPTFGDLKWCATAPAEALTDKNHGKMCGMGLSMEGIEQNSIIYELATDMMWRDKPVELQGWLHEYAVQRYGACPPEMDKAWKLLSESLYSQRFSDKDPYALRPIPAAQSHPPCEPEKVREAIRLFLACSDKLGKSELYQRDLVDILKQYLADYAGGALKEMNHAYETGDSDKLASWGSSYRSVLHDTDSLVATRPEYHLSRWIASARKWGRTKKEADLMEWNARMQVTIWGGPRLHDYAWKGWTGLLTDFYIPRWQNYMGKMGQEKPGEPFNPNWDASEADWEAKWCTKTGRVSELPVHGDAVRLARELFARYGSWPTAFTVNNSNPGIAVGKPARASRVKYRIRPASAAVDGKNFDPRKNWTGETAPQWLKIDLERPVRIDKIRVWPFWDWRACYQYTIDVSINGHAWKQVVDMSQNSKIATSHGDIHTFAPIKARYVRVNLLSDNTGKNVRLVEVSVYSGRR